MSHELRTPLHGILSFADLGSTKALTATPEKLHHYFGKINQSGKVLLALLNNLLDLSKLDAGRMVFEFQPINLNVLLNTVADEFGSLISKGSLTLHFIQPDVEAEAIIDPPQIMQVIRNLLSNAVKFSPIGGTIEISAHYSERSVVVAVRDQGIGIPELEREVIFDKFIQSSKTKTGAGGTGLGLSICRQIITAHQGRIWAENRPDGGAVFSFELPLWGPNPAVTTSAVVGAGIQS